MAVPALTQSRRSGSPNPLRRAVDTGKETTDGPGVNDTAAASVTGSTKFPTETLYAVTVTLDKR